MILNLQPSRSLDYEAMTTGEWLANCSACCVPELAGRVHARAHPVPHGDRARCWTATRPGRACAAWIGRGRRRVRVAQRAASASSATPTPACSTCTPTSRRSRRRSARTSRSSRSTTSSRASRAPRRPRSRAKGDEIRAAFELAVPGADPIAGEIDPERFEWSARVAVGLDQLVADFALDGLTYYYRGLGGNVNERVGAGLIVGNSLLTARGIPTAGEADLKTNVGHAPARPARRGRLVHRVLRARLRRGVRAHGPRRPRARRDRRRPPGAARARALPRQVRAPGSRSR